MAPNLSNLNNKLFFKNTNNFLIKYFEENANTCAVNYHKLLILLYFNPYSRKTKKRTMQNRAYLLSQRKICFCTLLQAAKHPLFYKPINIFPFQGFCTNKFRKRNVYYIRFVLFAEKESRVRNISLKSNFLLMRPSSEVWDNMVVKNLWYRQKLVETKCPNLL